MQNVLQRFGAKDTGLLSGRFLSARRQLTFTYVFILATILALSSAIIYSEFSNRLDHRFRGMPPRIAPQIREEIQLRQQDVLSDFTNSLLLVNGALLIIVGVFSYWFAGITLRPIQVAYNRQRRFLGDASHELRTPLAILRTDLENELGQQSITSTQQEQVTSHLEEVDRMGRIVADLLLLSRLDEQGEMEEEQEQIDLSMLTKRVTDRLLGIAERHNIQLLFTSAEKQITVFTNEQLLSHAIENVVKNAISYTNPGGSVMVSLDMQGDFARILIKDTGIGMSAEQLEKIFDRFYRVDASRSRQLGGSGLGLSIVQSIMHRLHGEVRVDSVEKKGTVVTLLLRRSSSS